MSKEEKWYNSFTREQLIERCEYLQRSCERKENTINDREMENADLEKEKERLNNIIKEVREYINKNGILDLNGFDILKILDKEVIKSESNKT